MFRTKLYADPSGIFVHDLVAQAADRFGEQPAIVDSSCSPALRISFAEYAAIVGSLARGLTHAGVLPGDVIAVFLQNSWEFCATYHAATRASAIPTLINPSYRDRELRYQLEASGAKLLISDGPLLSGVDLSGIPALTKVYTARSAASGSESFTSLLAPTSSPLRDLDGDTRLTLAALPFSSGTTGLPKGVMLSHYNLVSNVYQLLGPDASPLAAGDNTLCFLPLYHIYGLNVALNPIFIHGITLVLMPRFDVTAAVGLIRDEAIGFLPCVPPVLNAFVQASECGSFPRDHRVRWAKSGAAPLAPELARRFTERTGIPLLQGYGMTEASPVTHLGVLEGALAKPESIGLPLAQTECRIVDIQSGNDSDGPGELVMRGPAIHAGILELS